MASQASANQVQSMYIAYYGRPGDSAGINWWAGQLDNSQGDLSAIIDQFGNSEEYDSRYGNLSNEQLINQFYQNTFGRDADEGGLNFYLGGLESGEFTLASIAKNIWDGVTGADAEITADKLDVANYFSERSDQDLRVYGEEHIDAVVSMLSGVTGSDASEANALSQADTLLASMGPEIIEQLVNEPNQYEQYMLELINRARADPVTEAARLGVELLPSDPTYSLEPYVFSDELNFVAENNASAISTTNGQHPIGETLHEDVAQTGYEFGTYLGQYSQIRLSSDGGAISLNNSVVEDEYEYEFSNDDNRILLLFPNFSDIGLAFSEGLFNGQDAEYFVGIYTGPLSTENSILSGVVYDDNNSNRFYTPGEGIDDAVVIVTNNANSEDYAAYTMDAGGYQIALEPGTYDIMFSYNDQTHTVNDVVIGNENVKIDWMM